MLCADYITSGPLLSICGLEHAAVLGNIDEWIRLVDVIGNYLQFPSREKWDAVQRWVGLEFQNSVVDMHGVMHVHKRHAPLE
jgi:hypothetical protein